METFLQTTLAFFILLIMFMTPSVVFLLIEGYFDRPVLAIVMGLITVILLYVGAVPLLGITSESEVQQPIISEKELLIDYEECKQKTKDLEWCIEKFK